jgi:Papain family cysteine protease
VFKCSQIHAAAMHLLALFLGFDLTTDAWAQGRPAFVDLRDQQTPIRNQGGRGTCFVHSTVAAMEAALKRAGYGDVDLSEDAFTYFVKLFWMNTEAAKVAGGTENQVGGTDGGGAAENMAYMVGGLAVPEESAGWADGHNYKLPFPWFNAHWTSQFNVNSWNLSPRELQPQTLRARRYFSVTSFKQLSDGSNAAAIEAVLASGHEVTWGFSCCGKQPGNAMWTYDGPAKADTQGHSVLIVGYDRRDTRNPYFIIKNSWGPTKVPGAKGFTFVSYEYLQKYGSEAAYITGIAERSWPELRFVGRWALHFDGWEGILDITHVPGVFQGVLDQKKDKTRDQRIGIFFEKDNPSKAFRVNGSMKGNRIDFYIDSKNPNARCDQLGGRHFTYYLSAGDRDLMAGSHHDANGSVWGGYARRLQSDDAFPTDTRTINVAYLPEMTNFQPTDRLPAKPTVESYLGSWKLEARQTTPVRLTKRDDSVVPADKQAEWAGLTGDGVVALVNKSDPAQCELTVRTRDGKASYHFAGRLLSRERGVVAGCLANGGQAETKATYGATLVH